MMEKECADNKEAASPAIFSGQEAEEHREDDAGDWRAARGESEGQRAIPIHPRPQHHGGRDVGGGTPHETQDALRLKRGSVV